MRPAGGAAGPPEEGPGPPWTGESTPGLTRSLVAVTRKAQVLPGAEIPAAGDTYSFQSCRPPPQGPPYAAGKALAGTRSPVGPSPGISCTCSKTSGRRQVVRSPPPPDSATMRSPLPVLLCIARSSRPSHYWSVEAPAPPKDLH